MKKPLLLCLFMSLLFLCGCKQQRYFTNPILSSGADPWIIKHEGTYYYCCGMSGNRIGVSKSSELHKINPPQAVWKAPENGWNRTCVWAPELHHWKGKWYIYYAAGYSGPPFIHQKTGVLESKTSDPQGEYVDKGMVYTGDIPGNWSTNRWAIDMTLLEHNGELYAIWSGWKENQSTDKTEQHLYIAKMDDPCTISSPRVLISSPELEYEKGKGLLLNEGPQVLKHKKNLFIVYSCGQSWLPTYKLGCLQLKSPDADPLKKENWIKSEQPLFEGTEQVHGVGHASFATSPDGKEQYVIYHTKKDKTPGWNRDVRIQKIKFNSKGYPVMGKPLPLTEKIKLPSGSK